MNYWEAAGFLVARRRDASAYANLCGLLSAYRYAKTPEQEAELQAAREAAWAAREKLLTQKEKPES